MVVTLPTSLPSGFATGVEITNSNLEHSLNWQDWLSWTSETTVRSVGPEAPAIETVRSEIVVAGSKYEIGTAMSYCSFDCPSNGKGAPAAAGGTGSTRTVNCPPLAMPNEGMNTRQDKLPSGHEVPAGSPLTPNVVSATLESRIVEAATDGRPPNATRIFDAL